MSEIDKNIEVVSASLKRANEVGATDLAAQMQKTLNQLNASKVEASKQFSAGLLKLEEARKQTFAAGGLQNTATASSGAARTKPTTYSSEHLVMK
jgi:hypothetical protein